MDSTEWPADSLMQGIALENNLSETAYFKPSRLPGADFDLRWFTPTVEIALCGHATQASAYVLFEVLGFKGSEIRFATMSGILRVIKEGPRFTLCFPPITPGAVAPLPASVTQALGAAPREFRLASSGKSICVFETEAQIRALKPDFGLMASLGFSLIVTAPGTESDFVSRYFAPNLGVNEDPVTGAAHCQLIPYWANRLSKNELFAIQVSARQGKLWCRLEKDEVFISGYAVLFFKGKLERLL
jgi:PhzF family phenazine biosynthesis protein